MQRFVLSENLRRFRERLSAPMEETARGRLRDMILANERELALLDAGQRGVRSPWDSIPRHELDAARAKTIAWFRETYADAPRLAALIDHEPGLAIIEVNAVYAQSVGMRREQIVGQPLFELFPDNPENPAADGVSHLFASLRTVAETGQAQAMALQRYDTHDERGVWTERYWRPVNSPLRDDEGRLVLLLHVVEEATEEVIAGRGGEAASGK